MKARIITNNTRTLNNNTNEQFDTCCLCGRSMHPTQSHNPYPLRPFSWYTPEVVEGRCCSECNALYVNPARMALIGYTEKEQNNIIKQLQRKSFQEIQELM